MFCPKCGNQVSEKERFCGKCGAPIQQQPEQPTYQQPEQPTYQQPTQPAYQPASYQPAADPKAVGTLKTLFIVLAAAEVLLMIFWFMDTLYVSSMGFKQTGSFNSICQDEGVIITILNIFCGILGAIISIYPVVSNTCQKRRRMVLQNICSMLHVFTYALVLIVMANEAEGYGGFVDWGLTGIGWLAMILLVIVLGIPSVVAAKSKQIQG